MKSNIFEVRVALIGYVSVGKSTVLNALLGDQYSEVSMRRTTAGVNMFRIINKKDVTKRARAADNGDTSNPDSMDWSVVGDEAGQVRSAESTHDEIKKDNKDLRSSMSVHEKSFDVVVDDPICEMRPDTQLVLIDVPGINEADSSSKYKTYVTDKWNTFDCAIVVMDAIQGVNTEEQLELLKLVKANNSTRKAIHTIIVGNKFDDPDDIEKCDMVDETRAKMVSIFGAGCSQEWLSQLLKDAQAGKTVTRMEKAFLPLSALHAYLYRKASRLTFEDFLKLDKNVVDKIGHEEMGRRWKRLSDKKKFEAIHEIVSDQSEFKERIAATNFDHFSALVGYLIGGMKNQDFLITAQINNELKQLSGASSDQCLSDLVHSIHKKATQLGIKVGARLHDRFWVEYRRFETDVFNKLKRTPDPSGARNLLKQLTEYYDLSALFQWRAEAARAKEKMNHLVRNLYEHVAKKAAKWSFEDWFQCSFVLQVGTQGYGQSQDGSDSNCNARELWKRGWRTNPVSNERGQYKFQSPSEITWGKMSPLDWIVLLTSCSLPSQLPEFVKDFGCEKVELDRLLLRFNQYDVTLFPREEESQNNGYSRCHSCGGQMKWRQSYQAYRCSSCGTSGTNTNPMKNIVFRVFHEDIAEECDAMKNLEMPKSITNPSHWGHLAWAYCEFERMHSD